MFNDIITPNRYLCVRVKQRHHFGYWEIDLFYQTAIFRDNKTLPQNPNVSIFDVSENYENIIDYIKNVLRIKETKVIIPDCKVDYSLDKPICAWYKTGVDEHDPNTVLQCENFATTEIEPGVFMCNEHNNGIGEKIKEFRNNNG